MKDFQDLFDGLHPRDYRTEPIFRTETDKNAVIQDLFPHYTSTNPAHRGNYGFLAFGKEVKGQTVEYHDRLCQWDREAAKRADDSLAANLPNGMDLYKYRRTAVYWEKWLSEYYGKPVTLHCIYSGLQAMNGYWWNAFGFTVGASK